MKKITYITKCGCRLPLNGTKRKKGYRRICKEHGGQILSSERECLDCDIVLHLKHTGKGPFRCEEHATAHNKKKRHEMYVKASLKKKDYKPVVPQEPKPKWSIHWRGDYCTGITVCSLLDDLKCDECDDYTGLFPWNDPKKLGVWT